MAQFTYKAKAGPDEIKTGTIEAENEIVAVKAIRQNGLYPISVKESTPGPSQKHYRKISSKELTAFTRQLSNLVRSGFSLPRAVSTLIQQTRNPNFKKLLEDLQDKIKKGFTFSEALSLYPNIFSYFFISMVRIGETGGRLDDTLEKLADFKERAEELISQVKAALAYPALLLVVGAISIFILMSFVVPRLIFMFSEFGQVLPLSTRILIQLSAFMSKFWWLILIVVGLLIFLIRYNYKIEKSRFIMDSFLLRLPWLKDLIQKIEISKFSYSLGLLLQSGVSMLEALGVVVLGVENRVYRRKISTFGEEIRHGENLSSCLGSEELFPPLLTNMVGVGEESGELAQALLKIGMTFEKEVNRTVKTIVSLIEPILILVIGLIIGLIVLSILLPIFQMDILAT